MRTTIGTYHSHRHTLLSECIEELSEDYLGPISSAIIKPFLFSNKLSSFTKQHFFQVTLHNKLKSLPEFTKTTLKTFEEITKEKKQASFLEEYLIYVIGGCENDKMLEISFKKLNTQLSKLRSEIINCKRKKTNTREDCYPLFKVQYSLKKMNELLLWEKVYNFIVSKDSENKDKQIICALNELDKINVKKDILSPTNDKRVYYRRQIASILRHVYEYKKANKTFKGFNFEADWKDDLHIIILKHGYLSKTLKERLASRNPLRDDIYPDQDPETEWLENKNDELSWKNKNDHLYNDDLDLDQQHPDWYC